MRWCGDRWQRAWLGAPEGFLARESVRWRCGTLTAVVVGREQPPLASADARQGGGTEQGSPHASVRVFFYFPRRTPNLTATVAILSLDCPTGTRQGHEKCRARCPAAWRRSVKRTWLGALLNSSLFSPEHGQHGVLSPVHFFEVIVCVVVRGTSPVPYPSANTPLPLLFHLLYYPS